MDINLPTKTHILDLPATADVEYVSASMSANTERSKYIMTKPILLTSSEVALRKGISQRQVQRLAKAGVLPVHSTGKRGVLFFKASTVRNAPTSLR